MLSDNHLCSLIMYLLHYAHCYKGLLAENNLLAGKRSHYRSGIVYSCTKSPCHSFHGLPWVHTPNTSFPGLCRSQHIFIDPAMPLSPHGMAYSCVNFPGNQQSFNDGYHTAHHLNSRLHWTELPQRFIELVSEGKHRGETSTAVAIRGH